MKISSGSNNNFAYMVGLALLLFSNVCLYTPSKLVYYILLSTVGIIMIMVKALFGANFVIHFNPCFKWLTIIYAMFMLYGLCFLKSGIFNWDMMLFTYAENVALYVCFKNIFLSTNWLRDFKKPVMIATVFTLIYLIIVEKQNMMTVGIRIGDALSGNVNTVGASLGFFSIIVAFLYCIERKPIELVVFTATVVLMLLTGSKMTMIVLAMDLLLFLAFSDGNATTWLAVAFGTYIVLFAIFNIPIFYEVIGVRIEDMFYQLFGIGAGRYSNSTNSRKILIKEGFRFFWKYPLFGGGEKYFGSMTNTIYHYSHCNYTEMLCNFGIVGTLVYYLPVFINMVKIIRYRWFLNYLANFSIIFLATRFLLDWMQVTYSEICIGYIPMILSFVVVDTLEKARRKQYV